MTRSATELKQAARRFLYGSAPARRYLAAGLDLERFFAILRQRQVSYVVLRWFETLPHVDEGEDIDILVADEDLEFVHTLLVPRPPRGGSQKFDVYSVSGLPGSDFGGIPYYPPRFARSILAGAVWQHDLVRVPDLEDHFDSLSYHAVYHKGYASGLPTGDRPAPPRRPVDHDYELVLGGLARKLGTPVAPTLDDLDRYLSEKGLRPPLDTLERLIPRNPWIDDRFFRGQPEVEPLWQGLAVFVLREQAQDRVDEASRELDRQGFEILEVLRLDPAQRAAAGHHLRGGNWERGPWPVSGGPPSVYLVAYDLAPRLGTGDYGRPINVRIPPAKEQLRTRLLRGLEPAEVYNPVHSSDNAGQALDYLEALGDPELRGRVHAAVQRLVDGCAFPFPVIRELPAQARRARVALVDHPVHGPAVCKVFRPGATRFFERELRARTELGDLPEMPGLLDRGDRWLVTPYYADDRSHVVRELPGHGDVQLTPSAARAMARLAADLHARNLFLLDLSTQNLLSDPTAGLKVIDLEFLQEYAGPAPALVDSYTFRGAPPSTEDYDVPQRSRLTDRVGNSAFHPAVTGLPVEDLLRAARPSTRIRRVLVQLAWYALLHGRRGRSSLRHRLAGSGLARGLRFVQALVRAMRRAVG